MGTNRILRIRLVFVHRLDYARQSISGFQSSLSQVTECICISVARRL